MKRRTGQHDAERRAVGRRDTVKDVAARREFAHVNPKSRDIVTMVASSASAATTAAQRCRTLNDYRLKGGRLRARLKVAPRE